MDTSNSHIDTSALPGHTIVLADLTAPTIPVTVVREHLEVPQSPIPDLAMDEEDINDVLREAEGDTPSQNDEVEQPAPLSF